MQRSRTLANYKSKTASLRTFEIIRETQRWKYKIKARHLITIFLLTFLIVLILSFVCPLTFKVYATDESSIGRVENPIEQNDTFSFVVWGHPKRGDGQTPLHFEEILGRILELKANFLVITGDVINGMWGKQIDPEVIRGDWDRFDEGVKKLGIPVYRLPGNHDVHNFATRDIYFKRYRKPPFAFTYKKCRFILLDTVGIDQRTKDGNPDWSPQELPFSNSQLAFIRTEIKQQNKYHHIFFFMHHETPWRKPSGYWWKKVHPIIKGGRTRAVFSGNLGDPSYKYDHHEQDGIHYIQSSVASESHRIRSHYWELKLGNPSIEAMHHQFDNLQFVRVQANKFTIRTIVVGEWATKGLSSRFWAEFRQPLGLKENLKFCIRKGLNSFRKLEFGNLIWGVVGLLVGLLSAVFWQRWRLRQSDD
jgi:hypothetical protein